MRGAEQHDTSRPYWPQDKLAAALCQMVRPDEGGGFTRVIPHERAKQMTEDQVLAVFHFDHDPIPKAHGGPDTHFNLTPRPKPEHQQKTAKRDIPMIAKVKRLTRDQEEFRRRVLEKPAGQKRSARGKIPSRPFPKRAQS